MTSPYADLSPTQVTAAFWATLYERDWDKIATFFDDESIYFDVPTGPSTAGKGPAHIVARLQLGLEGIDGYDHHDRIVVATDGEVVMTEHTEVWHFHTGETVTLPFVSVQYVRDGVITMWKDYWDYQTLVGNSPQWWQERLFSADLFWIHDATGHPLA
jgi:limonene-1,2-epoxide hydrolase